MNGFDDLDPSLFSEDVPQERRGCGIATAVATTLVLIAGLAAAYYLLPWQSAIVSGMRDAVPNEQQGQGTTVMYKDETAEGPVDRDFDLPPPGTEPPPVRGFAIHLGTGTSFSQLSRRFAEVAASNAELGLARLEPRAVLLESANGLKAGLWVGPFATLAEAKTACAKIALPSGIQCTAGEFRGVAIARQ